MNNKTKKILTIVANCLITIFFVFAILVTIYSTIASNSPDGIPSVGDIAIFNIQTDSMKGKNGFNKGSLIISKKLTREEASNLKEGDVITYYATDENGATFLDTHRIVRDLGTSATGYRQYRTMGDKYIGVGDEGQYWDKAIDETNVVAIWTGKKVPIVGGVFNFMYEHKIAFLLIIIVPLLVFFIFEVVNVVNTVKLIKGKKTISLKDEEEIKRRAIEEYLRTQQGEQIEETKQDVKEGIEE